MKKMLTSLGAMLAGVAMSISAAQADKLKVGFVHLTNPGALVVTEVAAEASMTGGTALLLVVRVNPSLQLLPPEFVASAFK